MNDAPCLTAPKLSFKMLRHLVPITIIVGFGYFWFLLLFNAKIYLSWVLLAEIPMMMVFIGRIFMDEIFFLHNFTDPKRWVMPLYHYKIVFSDSDSHIMQWFDNHCVGNWRYVQTKDDTLFSRKTIIFNRSSDAVMLKLSL